MTTLDVHAALDGVRTALLTRRGAKHIDVSEFARCLRDCVDALAARDQSEALSAAGAVGLQASHCLPLLQRAALEDADDEAGLAAATGALVAILSGSGTHTYAFAPHPSVSLRLQYTPQSTGTHGRVWRAAHLVAALCADGWGGVHPSGKSVVDVGSGTGAAGLACAALGASAVWLTDVDVDALTQAEDNARLNGLAHVATACRLDVAELATSPTTVMAVADAAAGAPAMEAERPRRVPMPGSFELVLAADVPFDFVQPAALVAAVARLIATTPTARALVVQDGDPARSAAHRAGVREALDGLAAHPELRLVASEERAAARDGSGGGSTMHLCAVARR